MSFLQPMLSLLPCSKAKSSLCTLNQVQYSFLLKFIYFLTSPQISTNAVKTQFFLLPGRPITKLPTTPPISKKQHFQPCNRKYQLSKMMSVKQIGGYNIFMSKILGRGSFGSVYEGVKQDTNEPVAVKIISRLAIDNDEYLVASLKNQIKILQSVHSEHIVGFYDVMQSAKNYYIVQQLCDGDLSKILKNGEQLPQSYCVNVLTQICTGFLALVKEGIIHRDLKPANILCRGNVFKLGDFGYSKQISGLKVNFDCKQEVQEIKMKTAVGTPLYMSVQILKSIEYSSKCDIWALGMIFYEMLHGKTPWTAQREFQLVNKIEKQRLKIERKDLSANTVDFLTKCLRTYEKERMSWNEVFVHPIFQSRFLAFADENKEFQNKMKGIMTKLRIHFQLNRAILDEHLRRYGLKDSNQELSFAKYFEFLKAASPTITEEEAWYIFKKTDTDGNESISLDQILVMLKKYGIAINDPPHKKTLGLTRAISNSHDMTNQQKISQVKIEQCFKKLYKMIVKNNLTLQRVFSDFDKAKKGYLSLSDFKLMLQKLSKDITDEDAQLAFANMDEDGSGSLEFEEISKHFNEINSL